MAVDRCFEKLLKDPRNELRPPPPHISLQQLRAANTAWLASAPLVPLHAIENVSLPVPTGELSLRIYRPRAQVGPAIVYCHGGGFVLGDLDSHGSVCSRLAASSGATVLSVGYRLAPEATFPGPVDDCYAALLEISRRARGLQLDASRLAIAGDSAGANLALGAMLTARSRGPEVRYAALLYPMLDPDCAFPSVRQFGRGYLLSADAVRWFWDLYLPTRPISDPRAALLQADLVGLPPMSISTAECDPLRDEGHAFAERARAADVPVRYRCYSGMLHGFAGLPQLTPIAETAIAELATDLRAALE